MNKPTAINYIRQNGIMHRFSATEWTFTFSGEGQFAAINKGSDNLYYAHAKDVKATTHKTFMAAVASLLDCYLVLVHKAVNVALSYFKDSYNSIECLRYRYSNELGKYVVCNCNGNVQTPNGGLGVDLKARDGFALYRTELAAKAAIRSRRLCDVMPLEELINRESKRMDTYIKSLQASLPDNGQVVTFEA